MGMDLQLFSHNFEPVRLDDSRHYAIARAMYGKCVKPHRSRHLQMRFASLPLELVMKAQLSDASLYRKMSLADRSPHVVSKQWCAAYVIDTAPRQHYTAITNLEMDRREKCGRIAVTLRIHTYIHGKQLWEQ
jgi:hypothetical protein